MSQPPRVNSYDELPYASQPLPQSDPDRLASLATLFGLRPPAVNHCRVLEIGCATGENLMPHADRYAESEFVGLDYSERQVAVAREAAAALELPNIRFVHASIADVGDELGEFDYIICHGVFSWVAPDIQDKILEVCRARLNADGVAYVSYNTYPGWHLKNTLRELACSASPPDATIPARITSATRGLKFISQTLAGDQSSAYARLMKSEVDTVLGQAPAYLFHEYLEDENHAIYFYEFVERLAAHGLQYVADSTLSSMFAANMDPATADALSRTARDMVTMEQYLDLLRNRTFRQSLICHQEVDLVRHIAPERLRGIHLAGRAYTSASEAELLSNAPVEFQVEPSSAMARRSGRISSPSPAFKLALNRLARSWPRSIRYETLLEEIQQDLARHGASPLTGADLENLGHNLIQCLATGVLDAFSQPDHFVRAVNDRPRASRLARWQASQGAPVTSRRHEKVRLDQFAQQIVRHLDGSLDRKQLLARLAAGVERGEISVLVNGMPATAGPALAETLERSFDDCLTDLSTLALLVA